MVGLCGRHKSMLHQLWAIQTLAVLERRHFACVHLPSALQTAASAVLEKYSKPLLLSESRALIAHIWGRQLPEENAVLQKKREKIRIDLLENGFDDDDGELENETLKRLRKETYHWKSLEYTKYMGAQYLVGRMAADYASLVKIFSEISDRDEEFQPKTLMDFGSGLGSVLWAANYVWPNQLIEQLCIDVSATMNDMSQELLQGIEASKEFDGVYFRRYKPVQKRLYDVVVSAFSLFEMDSLASRCRTVQYLWEKCNKYLVIVENGTNHGYQAVLEARQFLLQNMNDKDDDDRSLLEAGHVFSPCPHDLECARYTDGSNTPCNFLVKYMPLNYVDEKPDKSSTAKYSYLVIKKGIARKQEIDDPVTRARIVRPVLKRKRHAICRMCMQDGSLQEQIFTAHKHGKDVYHLARRSKWGDFIQLQNKFPSTLS